MVQQYQDRVSVKHLCQWMELPRSSFHYRPLMGKPGAKPSTLTKLQDGTIVLNETVITAIEGILGQEFVCYGYQKVTVELKEQSYMINAKKVYRLMDENKLLLGKVIRTSGKRLFVQHRKIVATYPMECLCLDIKYVWVYGEQRWYYLLSVIDVYSRKIIAHVLQRSIKQLDVINLFRKINAQYPIKGVTIRNDNGAQFIANSVKQYLQSAEAKQEFTHIATPEENSYIEAYHSILQRELIDRNEFSSYYEAKLMIDGYVDFYNNRRLHGLLKMRRPQKVWETWYANNTGSTNGERMSTKTAESHLMCHN